MVAVILAGGARVGPGWRPATATGPLSFEPSGIDGGGFVDVIAVDPRRSGLVPAGGDVSGLHRSTGTVLVALRGTGALTGPAVSPG